MLNVVEFWIDYRTYFAEINDSPKLNVYSESMYFQFNSFYNATVLYFKEVISIL